MRFIREFKEFAIRGNVFDMAVGIIIGTAFHKIVSSLVNDIIMPPIGYALGNVKFNRLSVVLQEEVKNEAGEVAREAIVLGYGNFIQVVTDFFLIALAVFFVIRTFNRFARRAEDEKNKSVPPPKDIELLTEIRDLMKAGK